MNFLLFLLGVALGIASGICIGIEHRLGASIFFILSVVLCAVAATQKEPA